MTNLLLHGDCLDILPTLEENSIDAIVTDPPYGLSFMGKHWDHGVPGEAFWREALRVAKPGAHLLAFGGSRTYHRLACAIEDAGWEIRDTIMWVYGSGFPKSHNLKDDWQGWGTALKPAHEPIIMARKPFPGTVAQNVTTWGTGAINVDGGRVEGVPWQAHDATGLAKTKYFTDGVAPVIYKEPHTAGRWPANLIHDGSEEVLAGFPDTKPSRKGTPRKSATPGVGWGMTKTGAEYEDSGSAARFFYCAKASKADRDDGLEGFALRHAPHGNYEGRDMDNSRNHLGGLQGTQSRNHHPTVKPTDLMRYLVRLVTPPNGIVLDPFMGSGSTGKAAILEGFGFVGIEREREYIDIAAARIGAAVEVEPLFREYTNG